MGFKRPRSISFPQGDSIFLSMYCNEISLISENPGYLNGLYLMKIIRYIVWVMQIFFYFSFFVQQNIKWNYLAKIISMNDFRVFYEATHLCHSDFFYQHNLACHTHMLKFVFSCLYVFLCASIGVRAAVYMSVYVSVYMSIYVTEFYECF